MNLSVRFGRLKVVDPFPAPKVVPVIANRALNVVLETADPLHSNHPVGTLVTFPAHITTDPIGAML